MTEPFAVHGKDHAITIAGVRMRNDPFPQQIGAPSCDDATDIINTAARKYAADKIREAADVYDALITQYGPAMLTPTETGIRNAVLWLRSRADAVERGEA